MAGSDTLKRAWGSDAYLDGQQVRSIEFKHALVGEVIAGTEGYVVIIVLLEHPGNDGLFIIFRCARPAPSAAATVFASQSLLLRTIQRGLKGDSMNQSWANRKRLTNCRVDGNRGKQIAVSFPI